MKKDEILNILKRTNALLAGHFKLSSGLHSDQYIQCALALQYPENATKFGEAIANKFKNRKIDCVVGPALGGIIIAHEVAKALKVRCIFGERENDKMTLRRGFQLKAQEKVLIIEDVVTTGGSIKELMNSVKKQGANIVGFCAIVDRSSAKIDLDVDMQSLVKVEIKTFKVGECPLCKSGVPVVKPGSRKIS